MNWQELPAGRHFEHLVVGEGPLHEQLRVPLHILVGNKPGPTIFLTAAVHGDEINGIAIVREVMQKLNPVKLHGRIVAIPVVNLQGFRQGTRYTPDRRDLNRSFPGSADGSLASRIANTLFENVFKHCNYGIDLHTAASGRTNLCHVRGNSDNDAVRGMLRAFGVPIIMNGEGPKGSLRRAATDKGVPSIIFEAGEPNRFEMHVVEIGTMGILRVLKSLGMITSKLPPKAAYQVLLKKSQWCRASHGGILEIATQAGDLVRKGQTLGLVVDPFGNEVEELKSPLTGVVLGLNTLPLAHAGDAVVHIGQIKTTIKDAREYVKLGGDLGHTQWNAKMNANAKPSKALELEEVGPEQLDDAD